MAMKAHHKKVLAGQAPEHGEKSTMPAEGGGELRIFKLKSSPKYYGGWSDTLVGYLRQVSLHTEDASEAWARLHHRFGEASAGKQFGEPRFKALAAALAEAVTLTPDDRNIIKRLIGAFGDYPRSALLGTAGDKNLKEWHAARQEAARKAGERVPGEEVYYRHMRLVRRILKAAKVADADLPALPVRPTRRRAHIDTGAGDLAIIRAHLKRRVSEYRPGTTPWHGRAMLRLYFDFCAHFTGRPGSEALSVTFEDLQPIVDGTGRRWLAIQVTGKVGRAYRYAPMATLRLIAHIRAIHPTGRGLLFATPDGTARTEFHHLFRSALDALEVARGEPGKWTSRFVPRQNTNGGLSLYSLRHTAITARMRQGKDRGAIAQGYGSSVVQLDRQYGHLKDADALALL